MRELAGYAIFGLILRGVAATLGKPVDRHGAAIRDALRSTPCGTFLVLCCLLYRRGQGEADRLCIPAGGGLRAQVLSECHDCPLGCHFSRAKTGSLVRRMAFWVGQDSDIAEYVRTCQTCQACSASTGLLAPDDGGRVGLGHDSEPCGPAVWQGVCRPAVWQGDHTLYTIYYA